MKKYLFTTIIAAVFAACNSNPKTSTQTTTSDTSVLKNSSAADRGQAIELNGVSDTIVTNDGNRYVKVDPNKPQPNTIVSTPAPAAKTSTSTVHHTTTHHSASSGSGSGSYSGGGTSSSNGGYSDATTSTASTPVATKKKGWSKAAKGTAIGAGTGAIAGALISKKKGLGAVIGGVVGGAGGYIIGRNKDKKDGRY